MPGPSVTPSSESSSTIDDTKPNNRPSIKVASKPSKEPSKEVAALPDTTKTLKGLGMSRLFGSKVSDTISEERKVIVTPQGVDNQVFTVSMLVNLEDVAESHIRSQIDSSLNGYFDTDLESTDGTGPLVSPMANDIKDTVIKFKNEVQAADLEMEAKIARLREEQQNLEAKRQKEILNKTMAHHEAMNLGKTSIKQLMNQLRGMRSPIDQLFAKAKKAVDTSDELGIENIKEEITGTEADFNLKLSDVCAVMAKIVLARECEVSDIMGVPFVADTAQKVTLMSGDIKNMKLRIKMPKAGKPGYDENILEDGIKSALTDPAEEKKEN